jgi:hypothetical protein
MKKKYSITLMGAWLISMVWILPINARAKYETSVQDKTITINITGVEYDDPSVTTLREVLKGNIKVKKLNPGFAAGVAKISFLYPGKATELWDELPLSAKQSFKVTAIDDEHIDLQVKTGTKTTETAKTTTPSTSECIDCIYFKGCNLDTARIFNSITYKGYKKTGYYYNCINGALTVNYLDAEKRINNQVIFKTNEPVGTSWTDTTYGGLIKHVTLSKGLAIKVGTKSYSDIMLVYGNVFDKNMYCYYYAKGEGYIKMDTLNEKFNAVNAAKLKGVVDQTVTGIWKFYNKPVDMNMYYKFNGDGTYEYYVGSISQANQTPKGKCYWRINNNNLELFHSDWSDVIRIRFQKKNDPVTGKPTIIIQHSDTEDRTYFSETGNLAW